MFDHLKGANNKNWERSEENKELGKSSATDYIKREKQKLANEKKDPNQKFNDRLKQVKVENKQPAQEDLESKVRKRYGLDKSEPKTLNYKEINKITPEDPNAPSIDYSKMQAEKPEPRWKQLHRERKEIKDQQKLQNTKGLFKSFRKVRKAFKPTMSE